MTAWPTRGRRIALAASIVIGVLVRVASAAPAEECAGTCDGRPCTVPETGAGGNCLVQPDGCACVPEGTPTFTPRALPACVGDCDGDGNVRINELVTVVDIALGSAEVSSCQADCPDGLPLVIFVNCAVMAVNNALTDCPAVTPTPMPVTSCTATPPCDRTTPTPSEPELSLSVRAIPAPGEQRVAITAALLHLGGPAVWYHAGCSALCRPAFYRAITFQVTGPDGEEAIVEYPCVGPYYCAEYLEELSPGTSRSQTLSVMGTAWTPGESNFYCEGCVATPIADGHYVIV